MKMSYTKRRKRGGTELGTRKGGVYMGDVRGRRDQCDQNSI